MSRFEPGTTLAAVFLGIIFAVPLLDTAGGLPSGPLADLEEELESGSWLHRHVRPTVTTLRVAAGGGTVSVVPGDNGWLFFRPDVEHLTGGVDGRRVAGAASVLAALSAQLSSRKATLLVVPVPVKPAIYPEKLGGYAGRVPLPDSSVQRLCAALRSLEVPCLDLAPSLADLKNRTPAYLATDTHWTPAGVAEAAHQVREWFVRHRPDFLVGSRFADARPEPRAALGDTARMLGLPDWHPLAAPETVRLSPPARLSTAEPPAVILLGDSFANIYSLQAMGWGADAGLAACLEAALGRRVEAITRNDGGATAVRAALARRLAREPQLLDTVEVVVYQFSARELSRGDWRPLSVVPLARR